MLACDETTIPCSRHGHQYPALDEAFNAMEKNDRRKVVVLITDGEDLANSGVTTARALEEKGIVVYAVGVGTTAGSPIRVINAQGVQDVMRDPSGQVVISRLDETTLTQIATARMAATMRWERWVRVLTACAGWWKIAAIHTARPACGNWGWTGFTSRLPLRSCCLSPSR